MKPSAIVAGFAKGLGHKHADPSGDAHMEPHDLAEIYMQRHRQPCSTWTHALDSRPWCEKF